MKTKIIKYLSFGLKNQTGINASGQRTVLSKGSGKPKRKFRLIDFNRSISIPGIILRIEYDLVILLLFVIKMDFYLT
jgi:ribosomal protein L2